MTTATINRRMNLADLTEKQLRRTTGRLWDRTKGGTAWLTPQDWDTYIAAHHAAYRHIKEIHAELIRRGRALA